MSSLIFLSLAGCANQPRIDIEEHMALVFEPDHGCEVIGTITDSDNLAIPRSKGARDTFDGMRAEAFEIGANAVYVLPSRQAQSSTLVGYALRCDQENR